MATDMRTIETVGTDAYENTMLQEVVSQLEFASYVDHTE